MADAITLDLDDLRAVAAFAAACAGEALPLFELTLPADSRPRHAIEAALAFAVGGRRTRALRDAATAALKSAGAIDDGCARQAALSAMSAAAAAFLHPLPRATQVRHILGAAAHTARAAELVAGGDDTVGADPVGRAVALAGPRLVSILSRYPEAPTGGGRVGELMRAIDRRLRDGERG